MSDIDRIAEKWVDLTMSSLPSRTPQRAEALLAVRNALLEYGAIVREECAKVCDRAVIDNKAVQEGFHGELSPANEEEALVQRSILAGATFQAAKCAAAIRAHQG